MDESDVNRLIEDFAGRVRSKAWLPIVRKTSRAISVNGPSKTEIAARAVESGGVRCKPEITQAETRRASAILALAAKAALNSLAQNSNGYIKNSMHRCHEAFERAVKRQCASIVAAAKIKPALQKERIDKKRKEARKALADELRHSRKRLSALKHIADNAEEEARKIVGERAIEIRKNWAARLISAKTKLRALKEAHKNASDALVGKIKQEITADQIYPSIPTQMFSPHKDGCGLPDASGIYFLWSGEVIEYVGQSTRLCNRVRLGVHHVLEDHHRISYVFIEPYELSWAESYYIGVARPHKNFGVAAAHYKHTSNEAQK